MPLTALRMYTKFCNILKSQPEPTLVCTCYSWPLWSLIIGNLFDLYITQSAIVKVPNFVHPSPQKAVPLLIFCYSPALGLLPLWGL